MTDSRSMRGCTVGLSPLRGPWPALATPCEGDRVTPPAAKQCRRLLTPLASRAGQGGAARAASLTVQPLRRQPTRLPHP